MAWQRISPEWKVNGFKKCCVCSAVNGTDVAMLWNGSGNNVGVRSECEEDEGTDREDADSDTDW
jgi:hypothetical protein